MWHDFICDDKFFSTLEAEDARVAAGVRKAGCLFCGGRLDRGDYPRKPRGGEVAAWGERICRRLSFCCARDGCRHRSTPPSLIFFGRRVYLAVAMLVASAQAALGTPPAAPSKRTARRWLVWFRDALPRTVFFEAVRGRLSPVATSALPTSLVERFARPGRSAEEILFSVLRFLAPLGASPHLLRASFSTEV